MYFYKNVPQRNFFMAPLSPTSTTLGPLSKYALLPLPLKPSFLPSFLEFKHTHVWVTPVYSRSPLVKPFISNASAFDRISESLHTENQSNSKKAIQVLKIPAIEITPQNFAPFGQIVEPSEDGIEFGSMDANLDLSKGIPRIYIMRLRDKPLTFDRITFHASVTQCLASVVPDEPWYLAVAAPTLNFSPLNSTVGLKLSPSAYRPPSADELCVFRIQGPKVLKLHVATWHAGPMFHPPVKDFYNLELSDTNVVDHSTHTFRRDGIVFEIEDSIER